MNKPRQNNRQYFDLSSLEEISVKKNILKEKINKKERNIRQDIDLIKESFNLISILKRTITTASPYVSLGVSAAGIVSKFFSNKK